MGAALGGLKWLTRREFIDGSVAGERGESLCIAGPHDCGNPKLRNNGRDKIWETTAKSYTRIVGSERAAEFCCDWAEFAGVCALSSLKAI